MSTLLECYWHDGLLVGLIGSSSWNGNELMNLRMDLLLYRDKSAPRRTRKRILFESVYKVDLDLDVLELRDNAGAGQLVDGKTRRTKSGILATFELTGGFINICARRVRVL